MERAPVLSPHYYHPTVMPSKKTKPAPPSARRASTYDVVTKLKAPTSGQVQTAAKLGKTISLGQLRSKLGWK
jgi:hypothetical protein